ncbi:hypothetical protein MPSEU_000979100 [Mayamaea pseudoterrestris]|nr:hypothetical protein MPSEU_000979100 [Mayamaea pseudoterrestris]
MPLTRAGAKRKQESGDAPVVAGKTPRRTAAPKAVTARNKSTTKTCQNRALSVAMNRPIDVQDIGSVQNMYLYQAFDLRAVVEQVSRHSASLVERKVVQRLQYLKFLLRTSGTTNQLDERNSRQMSSFLQEVLTYIEIYMDQDEMLAGVADYDESHHVGVYISGVETMQAILEASEHFRQAIIGKCWYVLLELLRRHNVRLRSAVCNLLKLCFVDSAPITHAATHSTRSLSEQQQLSLADRNWNRGLVERFVDNVNWDVFFGADFSGWGMTAHRSTMKLLHRVCRAISQDPSRVVDRYLDLMRDTVLPLLDQYLEHTEVIIARIDALQNSLIALLDERKQLAVDMERQRVVCETLMMSSATAERNETTLAQNETTLAQLRKDQTELRARHLSISAREDEYKAAMALLR